ncbi:3-oxoacyl-[acyl-carrier-protein] synthase III C-terminal domain-containing protein [Pseudomonas sp. LRF_L74]|uniref:3-oxoacyl-[acyl-carrier-protein] synthase III C-terminal domain-containing protein n=1 Tax=Pseudomonas sp. LRF_L74 TaxID=3369422 RepID=UPI003F607007
MPSPLPYRPIRLLGTGHALPANPVSSRELDQRLDLEPGTVQRIGGVRSRPVAGPEENAARLGARAAHQALVAAGLSLDEIDCVVAASGTADQGMPCNAALIHRELGLGDSGVQAMDINSSCLSFIAALDLLSWPIAAGRYRRVLLVCADIASCGLDWSQLESSAIFGDGAAAVVIGPAENGGSRLLAADLRTYSSGAELCQIPAGGSRFHPQRLQEQDFEPLTRFAMNGPGVFRLAAKHLPGFLDDLLAQANTPRERIDWVVPHQASHLGLEHMRRRLGFAEERVIDIFAEHGNQIAASLPTALDIAIHDGRIQRGQRLLLIGTGAGLSLGGLVLDY